MDRLKQVEKLVHRTNLSYEEAKNALEISNWDMLDAMIYLENTGRIEKPDISIFYTNDSNYRYEEGKNNLGFNEVERDEASKSNSKFEGIFESICEVIDICNNIFIEISRGNRVFLNIPLTVVIILLVFGFAIIIPLMIIGLFFDIELKVESDKINTNKVNNIISEITKIVHSIKGRFNGGR